MQTDYDSEKLKKYIDECLARDFGLSDLHDVTSALESDDLFKQHYGAIGLRKILSLCTYTTTTSSC